jgi:hypothetical protein
MLNAPQAFAADGMAVASLDDDLQWLPFVGGRAGVAWRAGDHLQLGALATTTWSRSQREVGLALEVSWQVNSFFD